MRFATAICKRRASHGVTSIEYALIATLIAVAIIVGVGATGKANALSWSIWTGKVINALNGVLGP